MTLNSYIDLAGAAAACSYNTAAVAFNGSAPSLDIYIVFKNQSTIGHRAKFKIT